MATITTMDILDAGGITRPMQVVDISALGSGPFVVLNGLVDNNGTPHGAAYPQTVGGWIETPTSSFARPANTAPYQQGDIVTNSTSASFPAGVPSFTATRVSSSATIRRVRLFKSGTSATNATFWVHLFSTAPTSIAVDNAVFAANGAFDAVNVPIYLGRTGDIVMAAMGNGAVGFAVPAIGDAFRHKMVAGNSLLYWLLEVRAAYTPVSAESFVLQPEIVQD